MRDPNRLELTPGCHVDEVWPRPDLQFESDGGPVLVWRQNTPGLAVIRFRKDGLLTKRWPATAPVRSVVRQLFEALIATTSGPGRTRRLDQLERLLDDDFRFEPQGWSKADVPRRMGSFGAFFADSEISVRDVTVVADTLTVELRLRHASCRLPWIIPMIWPPSFVDSPSSRWRPSRIG